MCCCLTFLSINNDNYPFQDSTRRRLRHVLRHSLQLLQVLRIHLSHLRGHWRGKLELYVGNLLPSSNLFWFRYRGDLRVRYMWHFFAQFHACSPPPVTCYLKKKHANMFFNWSFSIVVLSNAYLETSLRAASLICLS